MKKQLTAFALATALTLTTAVAAESFSDVPAGSWYAETVTVCADAGLMKGTGGGNFSPNGTLTLAETATIAARMLSERTGVTIPDKAQGETWYQPYVTYLTNNGISVDEPTRLATRAEFFQLLAAVTERNDLTPINSITVLPDTTDENVLAFYNAGILTGTDKYGTFSGDRTLLRSEVAAMVARILEPSLRQSFVPLDYAPFTAAYLTPDTVMFTTGVTAAQLLTALNARIGQAENLVSIVGEEFNWFNIVGGTDQTVLSWVKSGVLTDLGVAEAQGTQAFKDFDVQVYYARLIGLTGKTLEPTLA